MQIRFFLLSFSLCWFLVLGTGNVKGFDVCVLMAVATASTVNILATL
jgi:hypothetical protein